ncbi:MAG TPA: ABC transporter ATP-binding protein [Oligoflexia bacterium]|nr:ABC transporter ATP-binding protein [Oligoflexia bacterium]HMP47785.1 ABC transporter ATP-binding protein [Oligoflexia bacterium]
MDEVDPILTPESCALNVHDLTVSYARKPVVWDINFSVLPGSLVGIIGPNGAGKSTMLSAILGLIPVSSGKTEFFGRDLSEVRSRVSYVPQRESIDWDFPINVLEVVLTGLYREVGWFRRVSKQYRAKAHDAIERVGIGHLADRRINQLSGGQQQRTFLARALVQDADLYLMDEPFAAVDAATESTIVDILKSFQKSGKTSLVVHHDLHTVSEYFSHVLLMNMRLVAFGETREVLSRDNLQKTYGGKLTLLDEVLEVMRRKQL